MFRAGQKVVCIDAAGAKMLSVGDVYTIRAIDPCAPRRWRGRWVNVSSLHLYETAPEPGYNGFHPFRFRPAVDRPTNISVFQQMLNPAKVVKREDA